MRAEEPKAERLVALVVAAALVLNYPILDLFGDAVLWLGIPVLYLYLFVAWAIIIALIGAIMSSRRSERDNGHTRPRE